jgi:hypothetical protein
VAGQAFDDGVHPPGVALVQLAHRTAVALPGLLDEK